MTQDNSKAEATEIRKHRFWEWSFLGANAVEWLAGMLVYAWLPAVWKHLGSHQGNIPIELPFMLGFATTFGLLAIRLRFRNPEHDSLSAILHRERSRISPITNTERIKSAFVGLGFLFAVLLLTILIVALKK